MKGKRSGVAPLLIVVILLIIVLLAAVAAYYFLAAPGPITSTTSPSSSQSSTRSLTSTTSSSSSQSTTSSSLTSSTGTSGIKTYSGNYNFTDPLGPYGERVFSNSTVQTYSSVQFATGSFTFSINPQNYTGTGSGHGTLTVTTTGFCSGKVTVPYTFSIEVTNIPGMNITVFFESPPTPGNATVPLVCTGPMNGVTQTENPIPFLSTYQAEVSTATVPVTVSQNLGHGITYYIYFYQTN
jgi:hypothetical protein